MNLIVTCITNLKDAYIDYLEAKTHNGKTIVINWDESEIYRELGPSEYTQMHVFKNISIRYEEETRYTYCGKRSSELFNLTFTNCSVCTEQDKRKSDIFIINKIEINDYDDTDEILGDTKILYNNINLLYIEDAKFGENLINFWVAFNANNSISQYLKNKLNENLPMLISDTLISISKETDDIN